MNEVKITISSDSLLDEFRNQSVNAARETFGPNSAWPHRSVNPDIASYIISRNPGGEASTRMKDEVLVTLFPLGDDMTINIHHCDALPVERFPLVEAAARAASPQESHGLQLIDCTQFADRQLSLHFTNLSKQDLAAQARLVIKAIQAGINLSLESAPALEA